MKFSVAMMLAILCVGCAITRERAVSIAIQEVVRRSLPLPKNYVTVVAPFKTYEEDKDFWSVTFRVPHAKRPLYSVSVNRYTHRIEDFTDHRFMIPAGL